LFLARATFVLVLCADLGYPNSKSTSCQLCLKSLATPGQIDFYAQYLESI
jgi:hypothetical protein